MRELSTFRFWRYTDTQNCWEFVRQFLLKFTDITPDHIPPQSIHPQDKRELTKAANFIASNFTDCEPEDFAVALHRVGRIYTHIGIVYNDRVWHTGSKIGTRVDKISKFENMSPHTDYKKWQS
jgi:hypothetical protein